MQHVSKDFKARTIAILFTACIMVTLFCFKPQSVKAYNNPAFRIIDNILVKYDDTELIKEGYAPRKIIIPDGVIGIDSTAFYGNGLIEEVVIPDSVTFIGFSAFQNCINLIKVNIPDSVTSIGSAAFMGCRDLTEITIPKSVSSIGSSAFATCFKLQKINLPSSLTDIGRDAFADTPWFDKLTKKSGMAIVNGVLIDGTNCKGKLTIPAEVKYIGEGAFFSNSDITSVTLPKNLKGIAASAFYRCFELKTITIPSGVTNIGTEAFAYCDKLSKVTIPASVKTIGEFAFFDTPWLETKSKENPMVIINDILLYGKNCKGSITIPNKVTKIADGAFKFNSSITSVKLPDTIKSIGFSAFDKCTKLKTINIPGSVTSIGARAFENTALTTVTIPASVKSLGERAFTDCASLTTVNIKSKLTGINAFIFYGCSKLTKVNIPDTVERIERYAFYDCTKLKDIKIPKKVSFFGAHPFDNTAWQNAMKGKFVVVNNILIANLTGKKNITIPDNVYEIAEEALAKDKLLEYVYIPDNVKEIGSLAFSNCPNLKNVYRSKLERNTGYGVYDGSHWKFSVIYVALEITTDIINEGGWYSFTAYVNGTDELPAWSVSDSSVASIVWDDDMEIAAFAAKKPGKVTVKTSIKTPFGILEDSVEVTVVDKSTLLFKGPEEVKVGESKKYTIRDVYDDAEVNWSISDESIAKITYSFGNAVYIEALKPGKVTLIADLEVAHGEVEISLVK